MRTGPEKTFEDLWQTFSRQIVNGEGKPDVHRPQGQDIFTIVARLGPIAGRLCDSVLSAGFAADELYVYPEGDVHTTILFITPYLVVGEQAGVGRVDVRRLATVQGLLDKELSSFSGLEVSVRGLGVFPTTIFAQLLPRPERAVANLRHRLASRLRDAGLVTASSTAYEEALNWNLSFANVARFLKVPSPDVVTFVERHRTTEFGSARLLSLEVVRTDKFLSAEETQILRKYPL